MSNNNSPFMPPGSNFGFNNSNFAPSVNFGPTPGSNVENKQDNFLSQFNSGNKQQEHPFESNKNLSVRLPEEPKNEVVYPGLESVQKHSSHNTFVFENMEQHKPETKPTSEFDFGFPEVKADPFFNQKNDDLFKTSSNKFDNNTDWDF
jgi:hypothetical protein